VDADNDGKITKDELRYMIEKSGFLVSNQEIT
jgi:Ca2+-binding EF-hand superfamily protein